MSHPPPSPAGAASPGQAPASSHTPAQGWSWPPNHMALAVVSLVLCCWPLGIPAVVYAQSVDRNAAQGNLEEAWRRSRLARGWGIAAVATPAAFAGLWLLWVFVSVAAQL